MKQIEYFFAALYQSIKSRRPDGTPYFNLSIGVAVILLLNLFDVFSVLKVCFNVDLLTAPERTIVICAISLGALIVFLFRLLIPLDTIKDIAVDSKDIKRFVLLSIIYYIASVAFMAVLLLATGVHL